jgi:MFS family permease
VFRLFRPYAALFAVPGSRALVVAGFLARLPMSMIGLGTVLLVAAESGSYGVAGAVSGTGILAFSACSPRWAQAMDRRGQGPVLRWLVAGFLACGVGFVVAVVAGGPRWSWFLLSALTGGCSPNVGSVVRARWAHALDVADRQAAFAWESVVDEVAFITGPIVVTLLATLLAPPVGILTGVAVGTGGGLWLAGLTASEPPVLPADVGGRRRRSALFDRVVLAVAVPYLAVGTVFGAMDVVVVAFAKAEGAPATAGLALAVFAGGSLVAGLVYGAVRLPGTLTARYVACGVFFALAMQLLLGVRSLLLLVPAAFLAGLSIAPILVSGMSLVESRVPRSALTEALAWTVTGLTLGVTAGSPIAGTVVDSRGAQGGFVVPAVAAAFAGVLALAGAPLLRRVPALRAPSLEPEADEVRPPLAG